MYTHFQRWSIYQRCWGAVGITIVELHLTNLKSDSVKCQWVLLYGKCLKRLICLGFFRTKQGKCLYGSKRKLA